MTAGVQQVCSLHRLSYMDFPKVIERRTVPSHSHKPFARGYNESSKPRPTPAVQSLVHKQKWICVHLMLKWVGQYMVRSRAQLPSVKQVHLPELFSLSAWSNLSTWVMSNRSTTT